MFLSTRQLLLTFKINFLIKLKFLRKLDFHVQLFEKNLKKFLDKYDKNCIIFVVVTRINKNEDEIYYLETFSKFNISKLRN